MLKESMHTKRHSIEKQCNNLEVCEIKDDSTPHTKAVFAIKMIYRCRFVI